MIGFVYWFCFLGFSSTSIPVTSIMVKTRTTMDELEKDGTFKRGNAAWRSWVSTGALEAPPHSEPPASELMCD